VKDHSAIRRLSLLLALSGAASLTGCVLTPDGWTALKLNDPPQLSPYAQPLSPGQFSADSAPTPSAAARPVTPPDAGRDLTIQKRLDAPAPGRLTIPPPHSPSTATGNGLLLELNAPSTAGAGETISFRMVVSNPTSLAAENVVIECAFDAGLEFPGSMERKVRQPLGTLESGASRSLTLALTALQTGRHCATFTVTSDNLPTVEREACVECLAPPVELSAIGPGEQFVGNRAEFVVTVLNRSGRVVDNARVQIEYDAVLAAREASAGVQRKSGELAWDLGALQIDERVQIQVEFECRSASSAACLRFAVISSQATQRTEKCLRIIPQPDPLIVSISDTADPAVVGEAFEYRLEAGNGGGEPLDGVGLLIDLPDSIQVGAVTVRDGINAISAQLSRQGNRLVIRGLPSLAPNRSFVVTIPATPIREGICELQATVESPYGGMPKTAEMTVVNPRASGASRASHSRGR
jgi:hypothetical protein